MVVVAAVAAAAAAAALVVGVAIATSHAAYIPRAKFELSKHLLSIVPFNSLNNLIKFGH